MNPPVALVALCRKDWSLNDEPILRRTSHQFFLHKFFLEAASGVALTNQLFQLVGSQVKPIKPVVSMSVAQHGTELVLAT